MTRPSPLRACVRARRPLGVGLVLAAALALSPGLLVYRDGAGRVVTEELAQSADSILVLGARVYPDGRLSDALADRLATALRLYRAGKAPSILVSGADEEPAAMRAWLVARGVPSPAIVEDAGGVDTYSSMARAHATYERQRVLVVTQAFHLPRALYLAQSHGLACQGVVADARRYRKGPYYHLREVFARVRAFVDVTRGRQVPLAK